MPPGNDLKLQAVLLELGIDCIGVYWCIVEMLHENSGYIKTSMLPGIANVLRIEYERMKSLIFKYDLFKYDDEKIWSISALDRIKWREHKSSMARQSIKARWQKPIVKQDKKYERNTIILNDIKVNENKKNKEARPGQCPPFPDLEQVKQYISSKNYPVNPEKWWNHYNGNGWKVGKNTMKNWHSAIATWLPDKPKQQNSGVVL
jgi:hypothetical protein